MIPFWTSCTKSEEKCGIGELTVITVPSLSPTAGAAVARKCKEHYVGREWLALFGRSSLANKLKTVLPVSKRQRSGDLGEILATEYVNLKHWGYEIPVLRLRWKDGRELPMRGEDAVGFKMNVKPIGLLKVEAKSRANLKDDVLKDARTSLNKGRGRPTPFVVAFIVERLLDDKKPDLARAIEAQTAGALLFKERELAHLLFVFCGNDPTSLLREHLKPLRSKNIRQLAVAVYCDQHQAVISSIYSDVKRA